MNKKYKSIADIFLEKFVFHHALIQDIPEEIAEKIAEEWSQNLSDKIAEANEAEDHTEKLVEILDKEIDEVLAGIEGSNKNLKRILDIVGEEPIEKICDEISKEVHKIKAYRERNLMLKQYIDDLDEEIAEERKCE